MSGEEFPFHDLTQAVLALAFKVHSRLGPGLLESAYEACLAYELRAAGYSVASQVPVDIRYNESLVIQGAYRMDLVVNETLVLELKAHEAQLFTYLRFSGLPVGLLLNFWAWPLKDGGIKRVILPQKR